MGRLQSSSVLDPVLLVVLLRGQSWHPRSLPWVLYVPTGHTSHSPLMLNCCPSSQSARQSALGRCKDGLRYK